MASTWEADIIRDGGTVPAVETRPSAVAHRTAVSIIVPSDRKSRVEIGESDAFDILFGETIDIAEGTVRIRTELALGTRQAILQLDWPDRGPVMLDVRLKLEPRESGPFVYTASIREVL